MERTILFKAKRLDNGEWIKGDLMQVSEKDIQIYNKDCGGNFYPVVPSTVCQYTGIYDRENKGIFENDLIKDVKTKEVFELLWNPVFACYSLYDRKTGNCAAKNFADYQSKYSLVVGNKFDRKEGEK